MTQTFAVNANNDLFIGPDGNLAMASGVTAVEFACAHAAKTLLGEMVLATDQGLPYFQSLWVGVPNVAHYEAILQDTLAGVDGVVEVTSLVISQSGDGLSYVATIMTEFGPGAVNG